MSHNWKRSRTTRKRRMNSATPANGCSSSRISDRRRSISTPSRGRESDCQLSADRQLRSDHRRSKRRAVISVNSRSMPERRRAPWRTSWSLASPPSRILFCARTTSATSRTTRSIPNATDSFASDLILPGFMIEPRLRKMKRPTLRSARVGGEFHASLTRRSQDDDLNHFPMIIVCHNKTDRRWFERSILSSLGGFPRVFGSQTLQRTCCSTERPSNVSAQDGADACSISKVASLRVEEQSFLLPNDEILTVLKLPMRQ